MTAAKEPVRRMEGHDWSHPTFTTCPSCAPELHPDRHYSLERLQCIDARYTRPVLALRRYS